MQYEIIENGTSVYGPGYWTPDSLIPLFIMGYTLRGGELVTPDGDSVGVWPVVPPVEATPLGLVLISVSADPPVPGPVLPSLEALKAAKSAAVQAEKVRVRDAGFLVGETLFDSDNAARTAYLELAMNLQWDNVYTTEWKASEGKWVTMDAVLFMQVKAAGTAHISALFDWQKGKDQVIALAQTAEEVQEISESFSA